ncbi:hypothetical protein EPJ69_10725 [Brachyspira aalborgi]|uniref:Uncharacterized protein n=1 Tax=Brachyspira aalborgi TaxID=29522 RepID=A0A5C8DXW5_9SPIR|nr:hypothetical protein [Brachyspira aalborgi]TXJ30046.1 hypothetical protein EPJ69_10725 [Brachyspira aalborgi]
MIAYKNRTKSNKEDIENYKSILSCLFNKEIKLSNKASSNNCIGALNSNNFSAFKSNFILRVNRILGYFDKYKIDKTKLEETLKDIANQRGYYEWSGKYSEIVALDYFTQREYIDKIVYIVKEKEGDIFDSSLTKKLGGKEIDLDFMIEGGDEMRIYCDVKTLSPIYLKLFKNIFERVFEATCRNDILIGIENDIYVTNKINNEKIEDIIKSYDNQKNKKTGLINELIECINSEKTTYEYPNLYNTLKFKISYNNKPLALVGGEEMSPYRLAKTYENRILDYYNKLLINKPSFIIFVINPWFSSYIYHDVFNKKYFYRSLSRRIFCRLKNINELAYNYTKSDKLKNKDIKVSDISKLISGIIYIEDNSVTFQENNIDTEAGKKQLYDVYIYTNPNTTNKYYQTLDLGIFFNNAKDIDDFCYDNY